MADDSLDLKVDSLVLDANAFGKKGILSIERLRDLVELVRDEPIEVWLPEPVLWEVVVHLVEVIEEMVGATKGVTKVLESAELPRPTIPDYGSRDELVDELIARVEDLDPEVKIIQATGPAAVEGLRDQILQRPPGRLKGGVRTGASDSTWIRSIEEHATTTGKAYAIVSADDDVPRALKQLGLKRPVFKDLWTAERQLFLFSAAPKKAIALLIEYLRDLPQLHAARSVITVTDIENEDWILEELFGPDKAEIVRETDVEIVWLDSLAGVADVEIDRSGGHIRAQVAYRAGLQFTAWYDAEVEGDIQLVSDVEDIHDSLIRSWAVFETKDNVIVGGKSDGEMFVSLPSSSFSDEDEVINEVVYALDFVPGLDANEIFGAVQGGGKWEGQLFDEIPISIEVYHDSGYKDIEEADVLVVHLRDDFAEVRWRYDPNSWVGGSDGFELEDAYLLEVDFETDLAQHPVWALPAWILSKVDP